MILQEPSEAKAKFGKRKRSSHRTKYDRQFYDKKWIDKKMGISFEVKEKSTNDFTCFEESCQKRQLIYACWQKRQELVSRSYNQVENGPQKVVSVYKIFSEMSGCMKKRQQKRKIKEIRKEEEAINKG